TAQTQRAGTDLGSRHEATGKGPSISRPRGRAVGCCGGKTQGFCGGWGGVDCGMIAPLVFSLLVFPAANPVDLVAARAVVARMVPTIARPFEVAAIPDSAGFDV